MSSPSHSKRLGIIGLGLMGQAMAKRFTTAGFKVIGWDVAGEACEALREQGGRAVDSAAGLFGEADRVVLCLPDSQIVRAVLTEAVDLRPGLVIIDTSTGNPEDAVAIASAMAARGAHYVDATISGSSAQVAAGTVTIMAGGEAAIVESCRDVFGCLGPTVFHVGPAGNGSRMKLVTNLVLGLNRAALAEGLSLAQALGLPALQTLEVLQGSMAYSRIMDTKGIKMISGDFNPQAKLSQHLKDVGLILEAAAAHDLRLPLSEAHRDLLERAEAMGCGEMDNSAIIRAFSRAP